MEYLRPVSIYSKKKPVVSLKKKHDYSASSINWHCWFEVEEMYFWQTGSRVVTVINICKQIVNSRFSISRKVSFYGRKRAWCYHCTVGKLVAKPTFLHIILNASDSILKQTDQYVCAHLYVAGNYAQQKSQVSKNVQKLISTRKNDQYSNVNCSAG